MLRRAELIAALRLRYDHYSAESVFEAARSRCGYVDQETYSPNEVAQLRTALARVGDRMGNVFAQLDALLDEPAAPAQADVQAEPVQAEPVQAEPKAEATKAEPGQPDAGLTKVQAKSAPTKSEAKAEPAKVETTSTDGLETVVALTGVDVAKGDELLMCGGAPDLGDWNPEKAWLMTQAKDAWTATLRVPKDAEIEFKFIRRAADGTLTWELGDNRTLVAKPRLEATWR